MLGRKRGVIFLSRALIPGICGPVYAAGEEDDMTLAQRMSRLEAVVEKGFEAVNQRIDDLNASVNQRFGAVNKRFDDLRFWLQFMLGVLALIFWGLVAQWIVMWRKLVKVEAVQKEHEKVHAKEAESNRLIEVMGMIGRIEKRLEKRRDRMEEQLPAAA